MVARYILCPPVFSSPLDGLQAWRWRRVRGHSVSSACFVIAFLFKIMQKMVFSVTLNTRRAKKFLLKSRLLVLIIKTPKQARE